jgi:hypothetical protein
MCVHFSNFCDMLSLATAQDGSTLIGNWVNWDCAGATSRIHGRTNADGSLGVTCTDFGACPGGFIWFFKLQTNDIFQMYGWDGSNPPFLQQLNQPYFTTDGACTGLDSNNSGIPSSLAR